MALAMQWVARVFAAALMMCLPGVGGQWLDRLWGTQFFGPAGFVLGLIGGVVYLIAVTRAADKARRAKFGDDDGRGHDGDRSTPRKQ